MNFEGVCLILVGIIALAGAYMWDKQRRNYQANLLFLIEVAERRREWSSLKQKILKK